MINMLRVFRDWKFERFPSEIEQEISDDDERRVQEEIQKITDEFILEVDRLIDAKEKDLLVI